MQERAANALTISANTVRWVMGPTGTTVIFPNEMGLPSIFETKASRYKSAFCNLKVIFFIETETSNLHFLVAISGLPLPILLKLIFKEAGPAFMLKLLLEVDLWLILFKLVLFRLHSDWLRLHISLKLPTMVFKTNSFSFLFKLSSG